MKVVESGSRTRLLASLLLVGVVVFAAIQLIHPKLTNPPVTAEINAPPEVKRILKTSCYNCHSNETHLWWYDRIAPASWLVARDVKRGRLHLNFSTFGQLSPAAQKGMLYESVNFIQSGAMPPKNYLLLHPEAKVTPEQLDTLKKYLHPSNDITPATTEATQAADQQFHQWTAGNGSTLAKDVKPVATGMTFPADYKNWKPVSTTDRFDNGTLRVILGNDVAQKAIASGSVHPWPDGSAFAKIAYKQQPDATGNIWTGEFLQVEFMLKDATKYKSSEGWGFGRWKTTELKPYGKTENFVTECTSCHAPMKDNDFVYTMPIHDAPGDAFNATAALPSNLPYDPMQWCVFTSFVDHAHGTMSTLYGNDATIASARSGMPPPNNADMVIALVTWDQQDDKHWFGGRIPGQVHSIEFVKLGVMTDAAAHASSIEPQSYELWQGSPLQKVATPDPATASSRSNALANMRAAVMP
jgi:Haem-binding domain/Cytochrome P460